MATFVIINVNKNYKKNMVKTLNKKSKRKNCGENSSVEFFFLRSFLPNQKKIFLNVLKLFFFDKFSTVCRWLFKFIIFDKNLEKDSKNSHFYQFFI